MCLLGLRTPDARPSAEGKGDLLHSPSDDTKSTLNTTLTSALRSFTGQTTGKLPLLKHEATKTQSPRDITRTAARR